MGLALSSIYTTACDYPGVGNRIADNDGEFVNVTLATAPEPGGALAILVGAPLLLRRRARG